MTAREPSAGRRRARTRSSTWTHSSTSCAAPRRPLSPGRRP